MKETCEYHVRKPDLWRESLKARDSELLQERDEWIVKQEHLSTERVEKLSRYHNVLSTVRRLVLDSISGEGRLEELVFKAQLLYEDSRKVPVLSGPSSHVVEDDLRVRE